MFGFSARFPLVSLTTVVMFVFSHDSSTAEVITELLVHATALIQTETAALPWSCAQPFTFPTWWLIMTLEINRYFSQTLPQGSYLWFLLMCFNICWLNYHEIWKANHVAVRMNNVTVDHEVKQRARLTCKFMMTQRMQLTFTSVCSGALICRYWTILEITVGGCTLWFSSLYVMRWCIWGTWLQPVPLLGLTFQRWTWQRVWAPTSADLEAVTWPWRQGWGCRGAIAPKRPSQRAAEVPVFWEAAPAGRRSCCRTGTLPPWASLWGIKEQEVSQHSESGPEPFRLSCAWYFVFLVPSFKYSQMAQMQILLSAVGWMNTWEENCLSRSWVSQPPALWFWSHRLGSV